MKWQAYVAVIFMAGAALLACSSSGGKKGSRAAGASSTATSTSTAKKNTAKPKTNKQTTDDEASCLGMTIDCDKQASGGGGDDSGDVTGEETSTVDDTSTTTTTDDGLDDGNSGVAEAADPDKEYFASILNPEQKETCHAQGMPFFRDHGDGGVNSGTGGRCYDGATYPPAYSCDRAGIASVSSSPELKAALDQLEGEGWYIDDCGVFNQKPIILLACYTAGDDACRKIEDIDNKTLVIKSKVIKLGG